MKWIKPTINDERFRQGFLFFPKTAGNEKRWLEHAVWIEKYLPNRSGGYTWFAHRWSTFTEQYLKEKGIDLKEIS